MPSDPILVIFHVIYLGLGAAMTHTGYEDLLFKDKRRLALGTFHNGTSESTAETRARKKRMYS